MNKETFKLDNKMLWIGAGLAVTAAGFGVWYFLKKRKEKQQFAASIKGTTTSSSSSGVRSFSCMYSDSSFPLKFGTCGTNVKKLQNYLNSKGSGIDTDGKFGPKTEAAVQKVFGTKTLSQEKFKTIS